jgi:hypothetical protein
MSSDGEERIQIPLEGKTVSRCIVDHRFGFEFLNDGEEISVWVGSHFQLRQQGGEWDVYPERKGSELCKVLLLFGKIAMQAFTFSDGRLEIAFTDDVVLSVPPHPQYEAWELYGSSGRRIISTPGGGLAIWNPRGESA